MKTDLKNASVAIAGSTHAVCALSGFESISKLFTYEITWRIPLPLPPPEELVGAPATLMLDDRMGSMRAISGILATCTCTASQFDIGEIACTVRPTVYPMTLGRSSRTFQSMTLHQILQDVLRPYIGAGAARLSFSSGNPIAYRVQRNESDWAFVERTISDAGLLYFFDHGTGSSLAIADSLNRGPQLDGSVMSVHLASKVGSVPEGIVGLAATGAAGTTAHAAKAFRCEKPAFGVGATAGGGRYEAYDRVQEIPGINDVGTSLMNRAKGRASFGRIVGLARTVRLYPGVTFTAGGPDLGEHVVTDVELAVEPGSDDDQSEAFVVNFTAAAAASGALPAEVARQRTNPGLSYVIISANGGDEVYPDAKGQVRAQHHWDRGGSFDAKSGTWLRPTQRFAPGSMMFPRTGWVVAAMGHTGDGDTPIALGRIHDGEHAPSYALPEHKTRVVYKTATTPGGGTFNEIHFEDKKGAEVMHIHASRNTDVITEAFKVERVHNDASHRVDGEQVFKHGENVSTQVDQSQRVTIGDDETVKVGGSMSKTVTKTEQINIAKSRTINAKDGHSTTVKHGRKLKVGAAMIDISLGQISRNAKASLVGVGGVVLRMARQSLTRNVGPVWLSLVGGIKYEKGGTTLSNTAVKELDETVGGSITVQAGGNIYEDSANEGKWTVANTFKGSAELGVLEAKESILIRCGNSFISLDEKGLTLSSTQIELDGGTIDVVSGIIDHNN